VAFKTNHSYNSFPVTLNGACYADHRRWFGHFLNIWFSSFKIATKRYEEVAFTLLAIGNRPFYKGLFHCACKNYYNMFPRDVNNNGA
jgi:hypothetical protein